VDWERDTDTTKPQQAEGRLGRGSILCLCGGIVDFIKQAGQLVDPVVKRATKAACAASRNTGKMYYRNGLLLVEMEALLLSEQGESEQSLLHQRGHGLRVLTYLTTPAHTLPLQA
jgi:hypothetical protein